jgi:type II secretory pathway component GspD/PulD (secretin)
MKTIRLFPKEIPLRPGGSRATGAILILLLFTLSAPGLFGQRAPGERPGPARTPTAPTVIAENPEAPREPAREIRLNFRGVPLEMVLDYLSEAAGLIVILETEVKGRVDVWSHEPLTADEAIDVLNRVLHQNGYAAIRNGRTLIVVDRDEARKRHLPVQSGNDPELIPRSDQMVTQVVPIRHANAVQLIRDLQPLLPAYSTLTANESSNAIVITDTQSNIRRMVEIVRALDTTISSISAIRVFPLYYADAKELATVVKELFENPTDARNQAGNNRQAQMFRRFAGGGGPPGGGGAPGGGDGNTGQSEARQAASRVVSVADERTNALVVSAPDEYIPLVEQLVREIDVQVDDITELRVVALRHSDPYEMAELIKELFPDETQNNTPSSPVRFGGRGGFAAAAAAAANQNPSDRNRKKGQVLAVPDARTSSIIISAASELMPQIVEMVTQLDSNQARNQKVFIYSLDHAEAENVAEVLREMFDPNLSGAGRAGTANRANNNPLQNRQSNLMPGGGGTGAGGTGLGGGGRQGGARNQNRR